MGAASERRRKEEAGALARVKAGAERLEAGATWLAIRVGALGLAGVAACAVLAVLPLERWPAWLEPRRLPTYAVASLAIASLLGWGIVQQGTVRLREACGSLLGGLVFVVLPLACGAIELLRGRQLVDPTTWSPPWLAPVIRWYSPVLVAVTLVAYVTWKTRPREPGRWGRGAGLALVVTPYALLMASLTFGLSAPWLQGPLGEAFAELGGGALAAQLALAFLLAA